MNESTSGHEPSRGHILQLYADERALVRMVGQWLKAGADAGEWVIVIARAPRLAALSSHLEETGVPVAALSDVGRLQLLDADASLDRFMVDGVPDGDRFDAAIGTTVRETRRRALGAGFRAYGEMVDVLWQSGNLGAATTLEGYWNRLIEEEGFNLYCAYRVDLLRDPEHRDAEQQMLSTHSHMAACDDGRLEAALRLALSEVFGTVEAQALLPLMQRNEHPRMTLPPAEAIVFWLRRNLNGYAEDVLSRARAHYDRKAIAT